jgi:hypothetical protein
MVVSSSRKARETTLQICQINMEADPEFDLRVTYPLEGVQKQLCHFGYQGQLKTNNEPDILK